MRRSSLTPRRGQKPRARPVDFFSDVADHQCVLLASMGFSTAYIKSETNLTDSQITYRIKKAGLTRDEGTSRTDFRNGTSPFAKPLLASMKKTVEPMLGDHLKDYL